ncbi:MAG: restriction endonuclease subunit S [Clostridium sp.]
MTPEIKKRIEQIRRGEVPAGYQKTILGIAPTEWSKARIDEISTLSSGSTPRRDNIDNFDGNILWVTSGELKNRVIYDTNEKISEEAATKSNLTLYDVGDVAIAIYGLEAAGVRGTASVIGSRCTISQACMAFSDFRNLSNEYFYYWYITKGQLIGLKYAQGTKQQNLSADIIGAFPICYPSEPEQQKIAAILITQDKAIELKEKLLSEKRRQKKYLCQQLLTGKKRLPGFGGEWKKVGLKKLLKERKSYAQKGVEFPHVTLSTTGIYPKSGRYDRDHLVKSEEKEYKITHLGDICYNPANLKFGVICVNTYGDAIFSPIYVTFEAKEAVNINFLSNFLMRWDFINAVRKYEEGTVYERMAVKPEDFLKYEVLLPPMKEQIAIAEILSTADREIDLLQKAIAAEKQKKKALMQLLLTGIVRVKV